MKFLSFTTFHIDKMAEVVKAADKLGKNPPEGYKLLVQYSCGANPFPGIQLPQGTLVTASIVECETAEAMAAASLEMIFAGASINRVPVMEISAGEAEGTVDRLKS